MYRFFERSFRVSVAVEVRPSRQAILLVLLALFYVSGSRKSQLTGLNGKGHRGPMSQQVFAASLARTSGGAECSFRQAGEDALYDPVALLTHERKQLPGARSYPCQQTRAQQRAGPMQTYLYVFFAETKRRRRLGGVQFFHVAKRQHRSILFRQTQNRLLQKSDE